MTAIPTVTLNNGVVMPKLGFGVFQIEPDETAERLRTALETGYRLIDTAQVYGNEAGVGKAIERSGLSRDALFVTTKLHPAKNGYQSAIEELDRSLERLRSDYVDLYLLHHPAPGREAYLDAWRALERLQADGRVRAIGVSNLRIEHLRWLIERSDTVPAVNQVEIHPHLQNTALHSFHQTQGIATSAWGALLRGAALEDSVIGALAAKYARTSAQVTLRWHLQRDHVTLVKSVTPSRVAENLDIFDFEISAEDMARITTLDRDPDGEDGRIVKGGGPTWHP